MHENICPHCGDTIVVTEADYGVTLKQVSFIQLANEFEARMLEDKQNALNEVELINNRILQIQANKYATPLFTYPDDSFIGQVIPKYRIYESSPINWVDKSLFVDQVKQITLQYNLTNVSGILAPMSGGKSIGIYRIQLRSSELDVNVLRYIDYADSDPIIFELERYTRYTGYEKEIKVMGVYKRSDESRYPYINSSRYFSSDWILAKTPRNPFPNATDIQMLYAKLLEPIVPILARDEEPLENWIDRAERAQRLWYQIGDLQRKLSIEKEFHSVQNILHDLRCLHGELELFTSQQ